IIDLGVEHGFIKKSGAWYTYEGDQLGQGKENARQFLKDNPQLATEIEVKVKTLLGVGAAVPVGEGSQVSAISAEDDIDLSSLDDEAIEAAMAKEESPL